MVERFGPLVIALALLIFGVGLRVVLHRRAHGASGVHLRPGLGARGLADAGVVLLFVGVPLLGTARALESERLAASLLFRPTATTAGLGVALSFAGTLAMALCQATMGSAWRVGIDAAARTELVHARAYRLSRNPIYVGLFAAVAGFALALPSWVSLVFVVGLAFGVRRQVRLEERHLLALHGESYRAYANEVGRWVRWLGRGLPVR